MESLKDTLIEFESYIKADMHTCLIAKITKINTNTINCLPVISREFKKNKVDLPEFQDVPLMLLAGGGSSIQLPTAIGDYCILLVSERSYDAWYVGNDNVLPTNRRTHDYSDCICIGIIKNKAGELAIPSIITIIGDSIQTGNIEHIGDLNQTGNVDLTGDITQTGNVDLTGDITQTGDIDITGDINVIGNVDITGSLTINGIDFSTHVHPNGGGGSDTGAPV